MAIQGHTDVGPKLHDAIAILGQLLTGLVELEDVLVGLDRDGDGRERGGSLKRELIVLLDVLVALDRAGRGRAVGGLLALLACLGVRMDVCTEMRMEAYADIRLARGTHCWKALGQAVKKSTGTPIHVG